MVDQPSIKSNEAGRATCIDTLDRMLARPCNQKALRVGLEQALRRNPYKFFTEVIMKLLPRTAINALQSATKGVQWQSLSDTPPIQPSSASTPPATTGSE